MTEDTDFLLVLGDKNLSSWSLRPWVLMRHAGIPFREQVVLFDTPDWKAKILPLSPSGRVPALRHGEIAIWDSLAIGEYIAELFPEKQLWPKDRAARAHARAVSAEMHSGFGALRTQLSMDVVARFARPKLSTEAEGELRRVTKMWSEARARYEGEGPFLFGAFSVADAMYAPFAFRFRGYDITLPDARAEAYWKTLLELPAMKEWEADSIAEVEALRKVAAAADPKRTPDPTSVQHCFAVIFSSKRAPGNDEEYERMADAMAELASKQPGYLGYESARNPDGTGITVSYWDSPQAITAWKHVPDHLKGQAQGRKSFYERYEVRVAVVERGYKFPS